MEKQLILYGLGEARTAYAVQGYWEIRVNEVDDLIREVRIQSARLRANHPSVSKVYIITNRRGLRRDYMNSIRENSIESHIIFKDILEREGMLIDC